MSRRHLIDSSDVFVIKGFTVPPAPPLLMGGSNSLFSGTLSGSVVTKIYIFFQSLKKGKDLKEDDKILRKEKIKNLKSKSKKK